MTASDPRPSFAVGEYVELLPTTSSLEGSDVQSGRRGIVQDVDLTQPADDIYLVAFLRDERLTGETAWLREDALLRA